MCLCYFCPSLPTFLIFSVQFSFLFLILYPFTFMLTLTFFFFSCFLVHVPNGGNLFLGEAACLLEYWLLIGLPCCILYIWRIPILSN